MLWVLVQLFLWPLSCLVMKHLCRFVDRLQLRALGAHVSCVLGVTHTVYILIGVCDVFSPQWYMSREHSSLSSFFHQFMCSMESVMRQLCKSMCVCTCVCIHEEMCMYKQAAAMLLVDHVTLCPDTTRECERARSPRAPAWWEVKHLSRAWWIVSTCTTHGNW